MSDKLNLLTSNIIRFVAGERPTADKFNAMNLYYTRAIDNVCRAIGDMHDRSFETPLSPQWNPNESDLSGRPLDILNLARLIGPASNLNPKMFGEESSVKELFSKAEIDSSKEVVLGFSVANDTLLVRLVDENSIPFRIVEDEFVPINNRLLVFDSDFSLEDGQSLEISYTTISSESEGGINYLGAGFNTIPDPNENSGLLNEITDVSGEDSGYLYKIHLSARKVANQQSGALNLTSSDVSVSSEFNNNVSYSLPTWWATKYSLDGSSYVTLPSGSIYLKNLRTGEIYLTAEYAATDIHTIYIRAANLCLNDEHRLILVGTDITTSVDDLRNKMFNHRHDGSFGEPFIRIQDLVGKYVTGEFGPSSIPGNEFPMYLHRKGYQVDDNARNGNNAMLGDLLMGNPLFSSTGEIESRLASRRIIFGNENVSIGLSLGALLLINDDPDTGNIQIRSANGTNLLSDSNTLTADQNIFNQTDLISNSTNNTEINSDNETHLNINSSNLVTLRNNIEDTTETMQDIVGHESLDYYSGGSSNPKTWNNNSRKVLQTSTEIEKQEYIVLDFEPSRNPDHVAPCGLMTQYDAPNKYVDLNNLFITGHASLYNDGVLVEDAITSYHDSKSRSIHNVNIPYESFILNYKKRVKVDTDSLDASQYGVWNQLHEQDAATGNFLNALSLGDNQETEFCFGGTEYSERRATIGGDLYVVGATYDSTQTHRFEIFGQDFSHNRDIYSQISLVTDEAWTENNNVVAGDDYRLVEIPVTGSFILFGLAALRNNKNINPVADFQDRLLEEINMHWGVKVVYTEDGVSQTSWLLGPSYQDSGADLGVTHDYQWEWSGGTTSEFDLTLQVNPRRLFKNSAQDAIASKDNYSFTAVWRPYNYTRPSLQPTELGIAAKRLTTDEDPNDWGFTEFSYFLLSGDYEEEEYPRYVSSSAWECVDQRVPVGADIDFLTHTTDVEKITNRTLCPISFGVLNRMYHPDETYGNALHGFEIHTASDETNYCRAASVGGSKQTLAIARNVNFEEGVSSKKFIINTNGSDSNAERDSTFLFCEQYALIEYRNNSAGETQNTYKRSINCIEKPNFLLHYDLGTKLNTTVSLTFNKKEALFDAEITGSYLNGKIINLSKIISKRFATDVWFEQFAESSIYGEMASYTTDAIRSDWFRYYGRSSQIKARLNCQKNWVNIQLPRSMNSFLLVNGAHRISSNEQNRYFWMPHMLQALFVSAWEAGNSNVSGTGGNGYIRMPFRLRDDLSNKRDTSYTRDIHFDINMEVKEEYNSYTNHLHIEVDCKYLVKSHKLRTMYSTTPHSYLPTLWSSKGSLATPSYSPLF